MWVQSLAQEDPLEKKMATHSKNGNPLQYPCLENPHGQRSLVGYSSWGHRESDMTERLSTGLNIWPELRMLRPAHSSLYLLCSAERERKKLIPVFFFSLFASMGYLVFFNLSRTFDIQTT